DGIRYFHVTGVQTCALPIFTHSDISNFLTCRRKWYYDYVLDYRPPEPLTGPLALGSRVHAALEAYYKGETTDPVAWIDTKGKDEIGRASCRERGEVGGERGG